MTSKFEDCEPRDILPYDPLHRMPLRLAHHDLFEAIRDSSLSADAKQAMRAIVGGDYEQAERYVRILLKGAPA